MVRVNAAKVQNAATAYRRGTHKSNGTNDTQYGGLLKLYEGADRERRFDDEDCYYAIRYPDKEPASYAEWYALLFADGMNKATRKIIMELEGKQNEGAALLQAGVIKVDTMGEGYDAWGGTDVKGPEDHKPVRKACWTLSGLGPGSYPIMMLGSTYLIGGSGDDIQGMIDSGAMKKALFGA